MNNEVILHALEMSGKLMELHDENPFKARAYANASFRLSKLRYDFTGKTAEDISAIEGVGKGVAAKIVELMSTGSTPELASLLEKTPAGVIEMLGVKGLGPKKVRQLWHELEIESISELLYACNENRLVTLKGFGEKTQEQVRQNIEFRMHNRNRHLYAAIEGPLEALISMIRAADPSILVAPTGAYSRRCEIIDDVNLLLSAPMPCDVSAPEEAIPAKVTYTYCAPEVFYHKLVELSSTAEHLSLARFDTLAHTKFDSEGAVYQALGMQAVPVELREGLREADLARANKIPKLLEESDLKGILHNHTTYSDGIHTLKEMADYCRELGFGYLGICDHSRTAAYAGGLSIESVMAQQQEIDTLNRSYKDFTILKGIESDILGDGSLDYPEEVLQTFDFVVASVHSNLKMSEEKATARLLKAIENPYTTILGHPSGRLLLGRPGYPLDYNKIIDACAANGVSIELNANPYRLDIDWRWIPRCVEKGVLVSINPDAHHREGFHDMHYGVLAARKGMLTAEGCLNARKLPDLLTVFSRR
jgi:DNA polymerase (family X)